MSDILYKAYICKPIICHTLIMNTIIIVLYLCMVTMCMCRCTEVSKNSRISAVYVHKESSLVHLGPFLAQGVHYLQYKHPAKALSTIVVLHSYLYVLNNLAGPAHNCMAYSICYVHLKHQTKQPIDLSLNHHSTHGSQL